MRLSLLPRGEAFFQLIEKHAAKSELAIFAFRELIGSWNISHPNLQKIHDIEHECDQIVHEIMIKLNKTFITPIDREDIQQLIKKLDDLVDFVYDLSQRMYLFRITDVRQELKEMADVLQQATTVVVLAVGKINHLKDASALFNLCIQIHAFENQGDALFKRALGRLFQQERDPLEVIKWKEIYDFIELAIDKCEDIADILWGIGVKYG